MSKILKILIYILLASGAASAVTVDKIYTITIQVKDTTPETRKAAMPEAFDKLIRKVASSHTVLNNHEIMVAREQADKFVNNYFYRADGAQQLLTLQYNELMLENLLANIGRASLGKNRPQILLWLVLSESNHPAFVTASTHSAVANKIDLLASDYGLPMILPLLDLSERQTVSEQDVIDFNTRPLQQASERYNADAILLGKLKYEANTWLCEWRLIDGTREAVWNSSGADLEAQMDLMASNLAGHMVAARGKIKHVADRESNVQRNSICLRINGINSVADYAKILDHLQQNSALKDVEIGSVDHTQATFLIQAEGGKDAIISALSNDPLLVGDSAAKHNQDLTYTLVRARMES